MPQQPHPPMHGPPDDGRRPAPQPGISWPMLLVLFGLIAGMWYWQSSSTGSAHPEIDYSEFYQWLNEDKVQSVLLQGPSLEGELKAEDTQFHTVLPNDDAALLPLRRQKNIRIRVTAEQQPFAVQLVLTLLPWPLIIGFWIWMSRRAQQAMASGGPLDGMLKTRSRK